MISNIKLNNIKNELEYAEIDLTTLLYAYEHGIDDGFFRGVDNNTFSTDAQRHAYSRGYDHGVWMYTENAHLDAEIVNEG